MCVGGLSGSSVGGYCLPFLATSCLVCWGLAGFYFLHNIGAVALACWTAISSSGVLVGGCLSVDVSLGGCVSQWACLSVGVSRGGCISWWVCLLVYLRLSCVLGHRWSLISSWHWYCRAGTRDCHLSRMCLSVGVSFRGVSLGVRIFQGVYLSVGVSFGAGISQWMSSVCVSSVLDSRCLTAAIG